MGEGMFMAVARKSADAVAGGRLPKARRKVINIVDKRSAEELKRWVVDADEMSFFEAGDTLYGCRKTHYDEIEALSGRLAVIYSGVAMGQIFKGKLKPDAALALSVQLRRDAVACSEVEEDEALQFLRKQDLSAGLFVEGMNLVVCRGQALGFVKRIGNRVNNLYPNSLRILK